MSRTRPATRLTVEPADGWTECDCPDSLCTHHDPVGMRPYRAWTVWDNERDEHAFITCGSAFDVEYERKRDAVAAVERWEERTRRGATT